MTIHEIKKQVRQYLTNLKRILPGGQQEARFQKRMIDRFVGILDSDQRQFRTIMQRIADPELKGFLTGAYQRIHQNPREQLRKTLRGLTIRSSNPLLSDQPRYNQTDVNRFVQWMDASRQDFTRNLQQISEPDVRQLLQRSYDQISRVKQGGGLIQRRASMQGSDIQRRMTGGGAVALASTAQLPKRRIPDKLTRYKRKHDVYRKSILHTANHVAQTNPTIRAIQIPELMTYVNDNLGYSQVLDTLLYTDDERNPHMQGVQIINTNDDGSKNEGLMFAITDSNIPGIIPAGNRHLIVIIDLSGSMSRDINDKNPEKSSKPSRVEICKQFIKKQSIAFDFIQIFGWGSDTIKYDLIRFAQTDNQMQRERKIDQLNLTYQDWFTCESQLIKSINSAINYIEEQTTAETRMTPNGPIGQFNLFVMTDGNYYVDPALKHKLPPMYDTPENKVNVLNRVVELKKTLYNKGYTLFSSLFALYNNDNKFLDLIDILNADFFGLETSNSVFKLDMIPPGIPCIAFQSDAGIRPSTTKLFSQPFTTEPIYLPVMQYTTFPIMFQTPGTIATLQVDTGAQRRRVSFFDRSPKQLGLKPIVQLETAPDHIQDDLASIMGAACLYFNWVKTFDFFDYIFREYVQQYFKHRLLLEKGYTTETSEFLDRWRNLWPQLAQILDRQRTIPTKKEELDVFLKTLNEYYTTIIPALKNVYKQFSKQMLENYMTGNSSPFCQITIHWYPKFIEKNIISTTASPLIGSLTKQGLFLDFDYTMTTVHSGGSPEKYFQEGKILLSPQNYEKLIALLKEFNIFGCTFIVTRSPAEYVRTYLETKYRDINERDHIILGPAVVQTTGQQQQRQQGQLLIKRIYGNTISRYGGSHDWAQKKAEFIKKALVDFKIKPQNAFFLDDEAENITMVENSIQDITAIKVPEGDINYTLDIIKNVVLKEAFPIRLYKSETEPNDQSTGGSVAPPSTGWSVAPPSTGRDKFSRYRKASKRYGN